MKIGLSKGDWAPLGIVRGLTTALSPYVCTFRLSNNSISAVICFLGISFMYIYIESKKSRAIVFLLVKWLNRSDVKWITDAVTASQK